MSVEEMKIEDGGDEVIEMHLQATADDVDAPRRKNKIVDFYHTKKSAAEGMMDISLLTANANQLKFILFYNQASRTFYPALSLIILSLVLQVSIGFLLIFRVSFQQKKFYFTSKFLQKFQKFQLILRDDSSHMVATVLSAPSTNI